MGCARGPDGEAHSEAAALFCFAVFMVKYTSTIYCARVLAQSRHRPPIPLLVGVIRFVVPRPSGSFLSQDMTYAHHDPQPLILVIDPRLVPLVSPLTGRDKVWFLDNSHQGMRELMEMTHELFPEHSGSYKHQPNCLRGKLAHGITGCL